MGPAMLYACSGIWLPKDRQLHAFACPESALVACSDRLPNHQCHDYSAQIHWPVGHDQRRQTTSALVNHGQ